MVATIQFGLVLANYLAVNHAAVVGARTASVAPSATADAAGRSAAIQAAGTFIKNTNAVTVTVSSPTVGSSGDSAKQVTVNYNLNLIFSGFVLPNPLPITATAIMRREQ